MSELKKSLTELEKKHVELQQSNHKLFVDLKKKIKELTDITTDEKSIIDLIPRKKECPFIKEKCIQELCQLWNGYDCGLKR